MQKALKREVRRLDIYNEEILQELTTLLKMAKEGGVAICICNAPVLRSEILAALSERINAYGLTIYNLNMGKDKKSLVGLLKATMSQKDFKDQQSHFSNIAISVTGLDGTVPSESLKDPNRPESLQILNQQRDFFLDLKHSILLWVPEWLAAELPRLAPDFWRIRSGIFEFRSLQEELSESLQHVSGFTEYYDSLEDINRRIRIYEKLLRGIDEKREDNVQRSLVFTMNLGRLFSARGDYDQALTNFRKSHKIAEELGDRAGVASSHGQMGKLLTELKKYEGAFEEFILALYIFVELQSPYAKLAMQNLRNLRDLWGAKNLEVAWKKKTGEEVPDWLRSKDQETIKTPGV